MLELGPMSPMISADYPQAASTCGHWQPYPRSEAPGARECLTCGAILRFDVVRCFWEHEDEAEYEEMIEQRDQLIKDASEE